MLLHPECADVADLGANAFITSDAAPQADVALFSRRFEAHLSLKEKALARTTLVNTSPGRYRPPDALLAFLEAL
jgi:hypothetical protein